MASAWRRRPRPHPDGSAWSLWPRAGLEATGRALSPYTIAGKKRWFLEPPHMQASLVLLPSSAQPPAIGDQVPVELRLTTAQVDQVVEV